MKKIFILPIIILSVGFTFPSVINNEVKKMSPFAAGMYLYINSTTAGTIGAGDAVTGHVDEVLLESSSESLELPVVLGGGGGGAGRPTISEFVFSKKFDKSSLRLKRLLLLGLTTPSVEIRIYDGVSNSPVYKMIITNVLVTKLSSTTETCSGSNCTGTSEIFGLTPKTLISWINYIPSVANPQTVTYNLETRALTFANL